MENKYESVIIITEKLNENEYKKFLEEFNKKIENIETIEIEKIEEIGKRKLAYEIKKNKEGYYVVYHFKAEGQAISELERNYRITDEVIKFMTIKLDD